MSWPLVSCVMPTKNRRTMISDAITCYQRQTYPNRELVVIDSGDDPVRDLMPPDPTIRYLYAPAEAWIYSDAAMTVGAMRNAANAVAEGFFIAHWDDDDYSHPERLMDQHRLWMRTQADVVGYSDMVFIDREYEQAWEYSSLFSDYALGTSFFYPRAVWAGRHFDASLATAEDGDFLRRIKRCVAEPAGDRMVATVHSFGTDSSNRRTRPDFVPFDYETAKTFVNACLGGKASYEHERILGSHPEPERGQRRRLRR